MSPNNSRMEKPQSFLDFPKNLIQDLKARLGHLKSGTEAINHRHQALAGIEAKAKFSMFLQGIKDIPKNLIPQSWRQWAVMGLAALTMGISSVEMAKAQGPSDAAYAANGDKIEMTVAVLPVDQAKQIQNLTTAKDTPGVEAGMQALGDKLPDTQAELDTFLSVRFLKNNPGADINSPWAKAEIAKEKAEILRLIKTYSIPMEEATAKFIFSQVTNLNKAGKASKAAVTATDQLLKTFTPVLTTGQITAPSPTASPKIVTPSPVATPKVTPSATPKATTTIPNVTPSPSVTPLVTPQPLKPTVKPTPTLQPSVAPTPKATTTPATPKPSEAPKNEAQQNIEKNQNLLKSSLQEFDIVASDTDSPLLSASGDNKIAALDQKLKPLRRQVTEILVSKKDADAARDEIVKSFKLDIKNPKYKILKLQIDGLYGTLAKTQPTDKIKLEAFIAELSGYQDDITQTIADMQAPVKNEKLVDNSIYLKIIAGIIVAGGVAGGAGYLANKNKNKNKIKNLGRKVKKFDIGKMFKNVGSKIESLSDPYIQNLRESLPSYGEETFKDIQRKVDQFVREAKRTQVEVVAFARKMIKDLGLDEDDSSDLINYTINKLRREKLDVSYNDKPVLKSDTYANNDLVLIHNSEINYDRTNLSINEVINLDPGAIKALKRDPNIWPDSNDKTSKPDSLPDDNEDIEAIKNALIKFEQFKKDTAESFYTEFIAQRKPLELNLIIDTVRSNSLIQNLKDSLISQTVFDIVKVIHDKNLSSNNKPLYLKYNRFANAGSFAVNLGNDGTWKILDGSNDVLPARFTLFPDDYTPQKYPNLEQDSKNSLSKLSEYDIEPEQLNSMSDQEIVNLVNSSKNRFELASNVLQVSYEVNNRWADTEEGKRMNSDPELKAQQQDHAIRYVTNMVLANMDRWNESSKRMIIRALDESWEYLKQHDGWGEDSRIGVNHDIANPTAKSWKVGRAIEAVMVKWSAEEIELIVFRDRLQTQIGSILQNKPISLQDLFNRVAGLTISEEEKKIVLEEAYRYTEESGSLMQYYSEDMKDWATISSSNENDSTGNIEFHSEESGLFFIYEPNADNYECAMNPAEIRFIPKSEIQTNSTEKTQNINDLPHERKAVLDQQAQMYFDAILSVGKSLSVGDIFDGRVQISASPDALATTSAEKLYLYEKIVAINFTSAMIGGPRLDIVNDRVKTLEIGTEAELAQHVDEISRISIYMPLVEPLPDPIAIDIGDLDGVSTSTHTNPASLKGNGSVGGYGAVGAIKGAVATLHAPKQADVFPPNASIDQLLAQRNLNLNPAQLEFVRSAYVQTDANMNIINLPALNEISAKESLIKFMSYFIKHGGKPSQPHVNIFMALSKKVTDANFKSNVKSIMQSINNL